MVLGSEVVVAGVALQGRNVLLEGLYLHSHRLLSLACSARMSSIWLIIR